MISLLLLLLLLQTIVIAIVPEAYNHIAVLTIPLFGFLHVLALLFPHWSVSARCFLEYVPLPAPLFENNEPSADSASSSVSASSLSTLKKAQFVKVTPGLNKGSKELCPLVHQPEDASTGNIQASIYFYFQKRKYTYDPATKKFFKSSLPLRHQFSNYKKSHGFDSDASVSAAQVKYGDNKFDIPLPQFWILFKEHALAPFFVFQVFCVGLWCLDEYWYYSLFTLFMLFMFEATVVNSV